MSEEEGYENGVDDEDADDHGCGEGERTWHPHSLACAGAAECGGAVDTYLAPGRLSEGWWGPAHHTPVPGVYCDEAPAGG